jgi:hypothetical protein
MPALVAVCTISVSHSSRVLTPQPSRRCTRRSRRSKQREDVGDGTTRAPSRPSAARAPATHRARTLGNAARAVDDDQSGVCHLGRGDAGGHLLLAPLHSVDTKYRRWPRRQLLRPRDRHTDTHSFKNGYCSSIKLSNVIVDVTLGTLVEGKDGLGVTGNAGKPYFELDFAHGQLSELLGTVYDGGKKLTVGTKIIATGTITSSGSSKGTFKTAKGGTDLLGKPLSVSGSWNCHGVFVKS